jgi:glyoxylase-like metal-dependent hydrolase (beta-lactamase superfamily II)
MNTTTHITATLGGLALGIAGAACAWAQPVVPGPLIEQGKTLRISDHVYVIGDGERRYIPNVGIIVGQKATLVIDPGLGFRNGEIVLAEARKVTKGSTLYVAATHHHPEHDLGAGAFPATAKMIRSRAQQGDVDEFGLSQAQTFASRGPELAAIIAGSTDRRADVLFDDDYTLDLGGVTVRMLAAGPAHTKGDTLFYVQQDRVLFGGDIAMQRAPKLLSPSSGVGVWFEALKKLRRLDFDKLVPSHGPLGDKSTIDKTEKYLTAIQARTRELKAQGVSVDEIAARLTTELVPQFAEWPDANKDTIGTAVKAAFAEAR